MNDEFPNVIVVTLDKKNTNNIIKGLIDCESIPLPESIEKVNLYSLSIDNKYYNASIKIVILEDATDVPSYLIEKTEALIFLFDATKQTSLEEIKHAASSLTSPNPDVKILVCDRYKDSYESNFNPPMGVQEWCIDNGWELVELNPEEAEDENDEEALQDDFVDSYGITRIKQALNAHTWSNLVLKDAKNDAMSNMFKALSMSHAENRLSDDASYELLQESSDDFNALNSDQESHDQVNDFENLLSTFGDMKGKVESMPHHERKDYAEKITLAFWRALGGDEEEITGLDTTTDSKE